MANSNKDANAAAQSENNVRRQQNASFVGSSNDPFSTPTRDNYQTYPYDYFSGTDCKIFFGDIWVDDIVTIQYSVSQNKAPIYGYASQNFDAIARGQVIVEGNLSISFKEIGYLNVIQATLESERRDTAPGIKATIAKYNDQNKNGTLEFKEGLTYIGPEDPSKPPLDFSYSPNGTPQIIRQEQTIEQILTSKKGTTNLASTALSNTMHLNSGDRDFEDFAEILEDSIWGDSNGRPLELENQLKRADEFDYNNKNGINSVKGLNYSNGLNILLTFGDINDYRAEHTMVVLNDVHFTNTSMVVSPNGDPIAEMYSFIARDVNKSINRKTTSYNIKPIKLNVGNTSEQLSRLDDINKVEKYFDINGSILKITLDAAFYDSWKQIGTSLGEVTFIPNKITPFIDQLSSTIEHVFNSFADERIDGVASQLLITVEFMGIGNTDKFTMILGQKVPNTKTYIVISPSRTGFAANNIITRDDIFAGEALLPPAKPAQDKLTPTNQKKNSNIVAQKAADSSTKTDTGNTAEPDVTQAQIDITAKELTPTIVPPDVTKVDIGPVAKVAPTRQITAQDIQASQLAYQTEISVAIKRTPNVSTTEAAAIIAQESDSNPNAVSIKGARGPMQVMDPTYIAQSTKLGLDPNDRSLTNQIAVGVSYYGDLKTRYNGNAQLALAAYNAGPGAVDKYNRTVPPYSETQNYVSSITNGITSYNQTPKLASQKNSTSIFEKPSIAKKPDSKKYNLPFEF